MVKLYKTAAKDGDITYDEERILTVTDANILNLLNYVKGAWRDKILDDKEKQKITFLIKKIYDDAISVAEFDNFITNEEDSLLYIIREVIDEFLLEQHQQF
ncbi:MAG: hypothetical protein OEZ01_12210 [Candidatus Heimdallarchaeota archaeon]|nr:hypothetical protein [Candidatus Heimdallarchaeota archaeon]